jgi:hypothetical protein
MLALHDENETLHPGNLVPRMPITKNNSSHNHTNKSIITTTSHKPSSHNHLTQTIITQPPHTSPLSHNHTNKSIITQPPRMMTPGRYGSSLRCPKRAPGIVQGRAWAGRPRHCAGFLQRHARGQWHPTTSRGNTWVAQDLASCTCVNPSVS